MSEQESALGLDLGSGGEDVKIVRSWLRFALLKVG